MESDENAPPSGTNQPTKPGLLSPFAILSGMRAILSPAVKDQQSQGSGSTVTSRTVLKDVNAAGVQVPPNIMNGDQGGPAEERADALAPPEEEVAACISPGRWVERRERTSAASETSFVSALSTYPSSPLLDGCQSDVKLNTGESDTDTSTAYESAGETEGNFSPVNDVPSNRFFLNRPVAVSSPFEVDEYDLDEQVKESGYPCVESGFNNTVQLEDSSENKPANLSVSCLLESLSSLSLSTPLKQSRTPAKAHVTLDSDVSGDIVSSPESDVDLPSKADTFESLETTITLNDASDSETVSTKEENPATLDEILNLESVCGTEKNPVTLSETVEILSDTSSGSLSAEEVQTAQVPVSNPVVPDQGIEILENQSSTGNIKESPANKSLEELSQTVDLSSLNLSEYEAKLLEGFEHSFHYSRDISLTLESLEEEDGPLLNDTVVEVKGNTVASKRNTVPLTDLSSDVTLLNGELSTSNLSLKVDDSSSCGTLSIGQLEAVKNKDNQNFEESHADTVNLSDVNPSTSQTDDQSHGSSPVSVEEPDPDSLIEATTLGEKFTESIKNLGAEEGKGSPTSKTHLDNQGAVEEFKTQTCQEINTNKIFENFDNAPLPVKVPRSFEEILAQQLEIDEQATIEDPKFSPSEETPVSSVACQAFDELPLPVKVRTFDEILAEQLAAEESTQGLSKQSNEALSCCPQLHEVLDNAVDQPIKPQKGPPPEKLNESLALIVSSQTSALENECEPDLVGDTVPTELELESNSDLDSLIEKCKRQQQDLEKGDGDFDCLAAEASRISLSCYSGSNQADATVSENYNLDDACYETVAMVDSSNVDTMASKSKVGISSLTSKVQDTSGDNLTKAFHLEEEFQSGDAFKDPSAFDFLILRGNTQPVRDLRKESLYVKFDPLVGTLSDSFANMHPENSSDSQASSSVLPEGHQPTESKVSTAENLVAISPTASSISAHENRAAEHAPSTPVKANLAKQTPVKTPAHEMLNETLESITSRGTPVKQEDLIKKLQEHQSILEEQDKAYQERISDLEHRLQEMDIVNREKDKQLQAKDKQLQDKVTSLSELNVIMKEYEKTISRLVAEKSQEKAAMEEKQIELVKDRDQAQQHLNTMEIAFADIHTKYERLKTVLEAFKKNEETLTNALAERQANFDKMQNMYDMLKSHAVSKLEKANQELEAIQQKHQQENAKLKAMIKKLEVKTKSLEEAIEQKVKENQALTAICDELINKVGE